MNIYILLDVLMCSIAEYFYELCCILSPQGESKYKQRVKILSDTTHLKRLVSDLLSNCFHLLAFLIVTTVTVVKTLKILKKYLFSTRVHTRQHSLRKTFSVRCEKFVP